MGFTHLLKHGRIQPFSSETLRIPSHPWQLIQIHFPLRQKPNDVNIIGYVFVEAKLYNCTVVSVGLRCLVSYRPDLM